MSILQTRFRTTTTLYIFPRGIYKNAKYRLIRFHLLVVVFHKMKCYEIKQANVRSIVYLLFLSLSLCMTQMSARGDKQILSSSQFGSRHRYPSIATLFRRRTSLFAFTVDSYRGQTYLVVQG